MNRTVAYQETSNNYSDVRQTIKAAQIATIKNFGVAPPAGAGDFVGQLGISSDAHGEALLYVSSIGGTWQLVGSSGTANIPDTVVMEDRKNNFTEKDQRIEDCQITYLDSGTTKPINVAVKGPGHCYVYESTPPKFYMSFDGHSFTHITTENDLHDGDVQKDQPNDFTNGEQTIQGYAIANIIKSSLTPQAANITPTRNGELYIQVAEGTADKRARMWISSNTGSWKWEALTHLFDLPATVAKTDQANDFQVTEQLLSGKQIMSFINGGDKNPQDSGAVPDYEGQFYIAHKTNQMGYKDAAIWVASGNQWLPIQENIELNTIVRNDKSNRFSVSEQILGEGGPNARWLIGAREKFSGHSPAGDQHWRVQNVGEITVYTNDTVVPREISVWIGLTKNPSGTSNAGEWGLVWSSKNGSTDFAKLNEVNKFTPIQYLSTGGRDIQINGGHEGGAVNPKGNYTPFAPGDHYTQSYSHPVHGSVDRVWVSARESDNTSWKRVLCEDDADVVLADRQVNFLTKNNFIGSDTDTKRTRVVGSRINHQGGTAQGVMPTMFGEILVCEEWDPAAPSDESKKLVVAYLAVALNREGWLEIGRALKVDLDYNGQDSND